MKRPLLSLLLIIGCVCHALADHITGGEIFYTYVGSTGTGHTYNVTIKLFMRCNSGRQFNNPTTVSVFDRDTYDRIRDYSVPLDKIEVLSMTHNDPCVNNPPTVCYEVGYYHLQVTVQAGTGFIVTAHVNFRIDGINNLISGYDRVGATYTGEIPGSAIAAAHNGSARFVGQDLVVVCAENEFSYSFEASDPDGDELRYSFCDAYRTDGVGSSFGNTSPPAPPPYTSVPYGNGYVGTEPLGKDVHIDPKTGIITGIAPPRGVYVVTVCVEELRYGNVIATQRKDLQIFIAPCSITAAALPNEFMLCGNTQTLTVKNNSTSPLINTYNWEFIDKDGTKIYETSTSEATYTFPDTGLYSIKLIINRNQQCSDSTMSVARVYPGFEADFNIGRSCITKPAEFTDATTSALGTVNYWEWDFGDGNAVDDSSSLRHPAYAYSGTGFKSVTLIVGDSKGCRDTVEKTVNVYDKPPIDLAFRDTLICPPDNIQLTAAGNGVFSWSGGGLSDPSDNSPVVSPVANTTYYVALKDEGCLNSDSVTVRVVDRVSLQVMPAATICDGDTIGLKLNSNALKYSWNPAATLDNSNTPQPVARPQGTTTYEVTCSISSCIATGSVTITTVPYPIANAGPDTTVCFNTPAFLHASTDGSSFNWTPAAQLSASNTLNPVALPPATTQYLFLAYDTKGCPKPGIDTITVTVQPEVNAFAGNDTVVVTGQPLQLLATGGIKYTWSPAAGLSDINIANPVANYSNSPSEGYYRYKVMVSDLSGCTDSAYVRVEVFSSQPDIYVPNAFTPNNDGKNDFFRIVAAGIQQVQIFRVYNRWGQLVYNSPSTHSLGWDGSYGGTPQPPDTYVWMVKALNYLGQPIFRRGTVTLIR